MLERVKSNWKQMEGYVSSFFGLSYTLLWAVVLAGIIGRWLLEIAGYRSLAAVTFGPFAEEALKLLFAVIITLILTRSTETSISERLFFLAVFLSGLVFGIYEHLTGYLLEPLPLLLKRLAAHPAFMVLGFGAYKLGRTDRERTWAWVIAASASHMAHNLAPFIDLQLWILVVSVLLGWGLHRLRVELVAKIPG